MSTPTELPAAPTEQDITRLLADISRLCGPRALGEYYHWFRARAEGHHDTLRRLTNQLADRLAQTDRERVNNPCGWLRHAFKNAADAEREGRA